MAGVKKMNDLNPRQKKFYEVAKECYESEVKKNGSFEDKYRALRKTCDKLEGVIHEYRRMSKRFMNYKRRIIRERRKWRQQT